ncbi:response regulator transcription factor [Candidatus Manganitrophus noduliformans]|uniref:Response regulator transcription factor n=1 Tax=Candidatus Manganitrophus noduliformans TaxID=2606439 RepID=A0A7X6DMS1_9BACT|nr:response regulator transcription factor [Candidatus Manganitrophus noduliformans]NKE70096.1 response regulator transcription factor [Candidatus Manganitrophus noduliformans]
MRFLVVEDEEKVARFVRRALEEESYAVDVVGDGEAAIDQIEVVPYDMIFLDLTLPKKGGLEVLQWLRQKGLKVPVLILTARTAVGDRVKGLDLGADDYLVKPFAIEEFLARVRALLRRGGVTAPLLQADDLTLDPVTHEVRRAGQKIELTTKEYALLEYFLRNPNRVLTRSMISEHVWDIHFDTFTNVIDVYVNYLRNKVDRGFKRPLIQTVRGVGYVLKA